MEGPRKRLAVVLVTALALASCNTTYSIPIKESNQRKDGTCCCGQEGKRTVEKSPPIDRGTCCCGQEGKRTVRGTAIVNKSWLLPNAVSPCSNAWLLPVCEDSTRLIRDLFGNEFKGSHYISFFPFKPLFAVEQTKFETECDDPTGSFSFKEVPYDNYYVVVQGFWVAHMRRIEVSKRKECEECEEVKIKDEFPNFWYYFVSAALVGLLSGSITLIDID